MRIFAVFLLLATVFISTECQSCSEKPCDSYTISDQITNLLSLIDDSDLTANGRKYRNYILSDLQMDSDDIKSVKLLQSLWAFDAYSSFKYPGLICVYSNLVKKSVDLKNNIATEEEVQKAFSDYGQVCKNVTEYSIEISMKTAGCPYNLPASTDTDPECVLDTDTINTVVNDMGNLISSEMKSIIKKMAKSNDRGDRVLAYSSMATFTSKSQNMIKTLLDTNELSDAVKVKCCNDSVSLNCCYKRKDIAEHRMKELQLRLRQVLP